MGSFLPSHADTPGQQPVDPADALVSVLLTAGLASQLIPPGEGGRAARWRDHVAGKNVLPVLDDAASHQLVAPLLPGSADSRVVITSRRRLAALQDAAVISLDTLPPDEAAGSARQRAWRSANSLNMTITSLGAPPHGTMACSDDYRYAQRGLFYLVGLSRGNIPGKRTKFSSGLETTIGLGSGGDR